MFGQAKALLDLDDKKISCAAKAGPECKGLCDGGRQTLERQHRISKNAGGRMNMGQTVSLVTLDFDDFVGRDA